MTLAVEARDLGFGYVAGAPVLQEWSAGFPAGTVTAITGPSGRGKSTLLYLLGLMLLPRSGEIFLDGMGTSRLKDGAKAKLRAERFGFVFQDAALDATRSILDNVVETALYRHVPIRDAAVRAMELLDRFEVGVPAERRPGQVSGGQAQRIALCRALVNDPDILLADEPTGNLDPETAQVVVDALISQARRGATVIVVTHSPQIAAVCDREIRL